MSPTVPFCNPQTWEPLLRGRVWDLLSPAFVDGGEGPHRGRPAELAAHLTQPAHTAKDVEVDLWAVIHKLWLQR